MLRQFTSRTRFMGRRGCLPPARFSSSKAPLAAETPASEPLDVPPGAAMLMGADGSVEAWKWRALIQTNVMASTLSPIEVKVACERFAQDAETPYAMLMSEQGTMAGWKHGADITLTGRSMLDTSRLPSSDCVSFLAGAFMEFDMDGDGAIDKAELRKAIHGLELPADDADIQMLMNLFDENMDDKIQINEWLDNMPRTLYVKLQEHAAAASWRRRVNMRV